MAVQVVAFFYDLHPVFLMVWNSGYFSCKCILILIPVISCFHNVFLKSAACFFVTGFSLQMTIMGTGEGSLLTIIFDPDPVKVCF